MALFRFFLTSIILPSALEVLHQLIFIIPVSFQGHLFIFLFIMFSWMDPFMIRCLFPYMLFPRSYYMILCDVLLHCLPETLNLALIFYFRWLVGEEICWTEGSWQCLLHLETTTRLKFSLHWSVEFLPSWVSFQHSGFHFPLTRLTWLTAPDALFHGQNLVEICSFFHHWVVEVDDCEFNCCVLFLFRWDLPDWNSQNPSSRRLLGPFWTTC